MRLATSTPARTGPISTTTATARKLGSADSAPLATSSRCVWSQVTSPTLIPAPSTIGRLLTATCSNCHRTSPNRSTTALGKTARVRATKPTNRPNCSSCQTPRAIMFELLAHFSQRPAIRIHRARINCTEFACFGRGFVQIHIGPPALPSRPHPVTVHDCPPSRTRARSSHSCYGKQQRQGKARFNGDSSLITTWSKGTSHTNPKRERGMPQVSCGATPAPSLTLRVGM